MIHEAVIRCNRKTSLFFILLLLLLPLLLLLLLHLFAAAAKTFLHVNCLQNPLLHLCGARPNHNSIVADWGVPVVGEGEGEEEERRRRCVYGWTLRRHLVRVVLRTGGR